MIDKPLKIVIAGGGTGGHLFPGIAIAEEFLKRGIADILFVGAGRSLEKDVLGRLGFSFCTIPIEGFRGRGAVGLVNVLLKLPGSMWKAYRITRSFHPHAVIGVGGYSSGPVVLMAHFMGIWTAVAEQNALPGFTNRILGKFADRIFLTYGETRKWFSEEKAVVTGNPVRAVFLAGAKDAHERGERFTILVFGGSQGARSINRTMLGALSHLGSKNIRIIHQTGDDELGYVSGVYKNYGFDAEVRPFIQDMAAAYREADLVICRAGATSIAEITAMGKAAILIPFPFAVDNHQKKNAEALARAGAALMIEERELKGKEFAEIIERFYDNRESLRVMEQKSASLSNVRAAADIVDACLALIGDKTEVRS
ncbi:MAG TPA: undecaprenyldiphospho-muramoylpentapeptide beta-N-acetylglucosaminyltransferase [Syntrophales bacterium]|nr:undecaprenyldiphospho-muramoylpentapeptide beta-N-acetylglucosaminyltransferase [Syntrophales bacterium]